MTRGVLWEVPRAQRPRVSVVMVSYGAAVWVQRALRALVAHTEPGYEVIVVDNASPDGTAEILRRHASGLRLLANERNVGFGPACNQGALHAVAPVLCFLNPDALVQPGWLPPLLEVLDRDPAAGAAVPRLLNLDGSLQEAGCIVGRDGSTQSLGYGDDPERTWHRFPRVVDYGSATCMVVRRRAFTAVGGFDPTFAPAYCEDVDLCFRLAEAGWRTVYEPRSVVRHLRGVSSPPGEVAELVARNTARLRERWGERLARRPSIRELPAYAHRSIAARDALTDGRILVTAASLGGGSAPRLLLSDLAARYSTCRITLALSRPADPATVEELLAAGVEVVAAPIDWEDFFERRWFHYDVVVDADPDPDLDLQVARTQPQAVRLAADTLTLTVPDRLASLVCARLLALCANKRAHTRGHT